MLLATGPLENSVYLSRKIGKHLLVLWVTLHVPSLNQNLDLLLYHSRLSFKHRDHPHVFGDQFLISHLLSSLHDLDRSCLNDYLTFDLYFFLRLLFTSILSCFLLLARSCWNQVDPNVVACKLLIEFNLLIRVIKSWFLNGLVQKSNFGIAELE